MAQTFHFDKTKDLIIGDDLTLTFEVFDDDLILRSGTLPNGRPGLVYVSGTPIDVSAWTFAFTVRSTDVTEDAPVLEKTSADGISVTGVFDADHDVNTQRVVVSIPDTETFSDAEEVLIPPATYFYSLKRTNAGAEKTIAKGKFVLQEFPRRL